MEFRLACSTQRYPQCADTDGRGPGWVTYCSGGPLSFAGSGCASLPTHPTFLMFSPCLRLSLDLSETAGQARHETCESLVNRPVLQFKSNSMQATAMSLAQVRWHPQAGTLRISHHMYHEVYRKLALIRMSQVR